METTVISNKTEIRVRYGETDKMGYVYYGNYPLYFEVGRTELMRTLGYPYSKIEEMGLMLPVNSMNVKYFKPAIYDDLLIIETGLKEIPNVKITFLYKVFNQNNDLITEGETTLVFVDEQKRKPRRAPKELLDAINSKISEQKV